MAKQDAERVILHNRAGESGRGADPRGSELGFRWAHSLSHSLATYSLKVPTS